ELIGPDNSRSYVRRLAERIEEIVEAGDHRVVIKAPMSAKDRPMIACQVECSTQPWRDCVIGERVWTSGYLALVESGANADIQRRRMGRGPGARPEDRAPSLSRTVRHAIR